MLCSALRVGTFSHCSELAGWFIYWSRCHLLSLFFFVHNYRNRWHTWRLNRTMPKLPEKRLEGSGQRWKPFKSMTLLFCTFYWHCAKFQSILQKKKIFIAKCLVRCSYSMMRLPQPRCAVAGPESRGGIHDHRHGHQSGGGGAALHLLHLPQEASAEFYLFLSFKVWICCCCKQCNCFVTLDSFKGSTIIWKDRWSLRTTCVRSWSEK